MQITIKSKQMDVSAGIRAHIEQKLQRLSRLVGDDARMDVTVVDEKTRSAKDRYAVHLGCTNVRHVNAIHATATDVNVMTALDLALDKVTAQLGRQKDRHTAAHRLPVSAVQVLTLSRAGDIASTDDMSTEEALNSADNEEIWSQIKEIQRVETKSMNDHEVIARMEHDNLAFCPFINAETASVNVMYRLADGQGYGLLVPAMGHIAE